MNAIDQLQDEQVERRRGRSGGSGYSDDMKFWVPECTRPYVRTGGCGEALTGDPHNS